MQPNFGVLPYKVQIFFGSPSESIVELKIFLGYLKMKDVTIK